MQANTQSKIISKVLAPALQLWLRSQLDRVEELDIQITGGDRQILGGYIPGVSLASRRAIYQGLHLGQVQLTGENLRINLTQVLKGKPLRLLEPVSVTGQVLLEEGDLIASISSSLLSNAFTDLLLILLQANGIFNAISILEDYQVGWQAVRLQTDKFTLTGTLTHRGGQTTPVMIRSGLGLVNSQTLHLHPLHIEALPELLNISLQELTVDLGSDVEIEKLSLEAGKLSCQGRLRVLP